MELFKRIKLVSFLISLFCLHAADMEAQTTATYSGFNKEYQPTQDEIDAEIALIPLKDNQVYYEAVFKTSDNLKEMHYKVRKWFVNTFKSINSTIQIDDKEEGMVVGKAVSLFSFKSGVKKSNVSFYFTLHVEYGNAGVMVKVYNMYGKDLRTNNLQKTFDAANAILNGYSFDEKDATDELNIDITQSYVDYLNNKKRKYNGKVIYSIAQEVKTILESLEEALNKQRESVTPTVSLDRPNK